MNYLFHKFIDISVDYLSSLYSVHSKTKKDIYYIPSELILKKLQITIEELKDLIENEQRNNVLHFGLKIIENSQDVKELENKIVLFFRNYPPVEKDEFKSALNLFHEGKFEKKGERMKKKGSKDNFDINDFSNEGIILIDSVSKFAFTAIKYSSWEFDNIMNIFNWKKFEDFIADILEEFYGYKTITNFRFSNDKESRNMHQLKSKTTKKLQNRFEIDIIGVKNREILFIDAKRWKDMGDHYSSLSISGDFQKSRALIFSKNRNAVLKLFESIKLNPDAQIIEKKKIDPQLNKKQNYRIYPIIVYKGHSSKNITKSKVPIVNVGHLPDFLLNFYGNKDLYAKSELKSLLMQSKF